MSFPLFLYKTISHISHLRASGLSRCRGLDVQHWVELLKFSLSTNPWWCLRRIQQQSWGFTFQEHLFSVRKKAACVTQLWLHTSLISCQGVVTSCAEHPKVDTHSRFIKGVKVVKCQDQTKGSLENWSKMGSEGTTRRLEEAADAHQTWRVISLH